MKYSSDYYVLPWDAFSVTFTTAFNFVFKNKGTSSSKFRLVRMHCSFSLLDSTAVKPVLVKDSFVNVFMGAIFQGPFQIVEPLPGAYQTTSAVIFFPAQQPTIDLGIVFGRGDLQLLVSLSDTNAVAGYDQVECRGFIQFEELAN